MSKITKTAFERKFVFDPDKIRFGKHGKPLMRRDGKPYKGDYVRRAEPLPAQPRELIALKYRGTQLAPVLVAPGQVINPRKEYFRQLGISRKKRGKIKK